MLSLPSHTATSDNCHQVATVVLEKTRARHYILCCVLPGRPTSFPTPGDLSLSHLNWRSLICCNGHKREGQSVQASWVWAQLPRPPLFCCDLEQNFGAFWDLVSFPPMK